MKTYLFIVLIIVCMCGWAKAAYSAIDTDRASGQCAGLFTIEHNTKKATEALQMADNLNRATKFAYTWLQTIIDYSQKDINVSGMYINAANDCKTLGVHR